jgi:cysteinyl-tRNA synthetase, unknown class
MAPLIHALQLTRRTILAALVSAAAVVHAKAGSARTLSRPRQNSLEALKRVSHWGCQYQNVDLTAISESDLDLIVLDPSLDDGGRRFISPAECSTLKTKPGGGRRLVIAYLCVGEADTKRWYWPDAWRRNPPDWVGPENASWPGSRSVQYWNGEWQTLVAHGAESILNQIMDTGFDGVFLDRVDAYGDWESSPAALESMANFVADIGERARTRNPEF